MSDSELEEILAEADEASLDEPMAAFEDSALRRFLGLFVVPLLVVVASVLVFVGFGWIAIESNSLSDYLNDMQSGWKPRRTQAAFELSKILIADPDALEQEPEAMAQLLQLFRDSEDEGMRRYLALVLGYSHEPEAVPLLIEALGDEDDQLRIYALWGLGAHGDPAGLDPLIQASTDDDAGIRKMAAYGLGELGMAAAIPDLERLLEDPVEEVRFNAALSLARLGEVTAVPVLEQMLDRQLLAQVPDISAEQQEEIMISATEALTVLQGEAALDTLLALEQNDPSLKVRQAAITARKALEAAAR